MRIAYFTSNRTTIPSKPSEIAASTSVTLNIIKELSKKHEITLYAAKGSRVEGVNIIDLNLPPFEIDSSIGNTDWITKAVLGIKQIYLGEILKNSRSYDIIHLQNEPVYLGMPFVDLIKTPVLFTTHNVCHEYEQYIFNYYDTKRYISMISQNQAKTFPLTQSTPVIYDGIDVDKYPFYENAKGYFLFLGRLTKEKGIYEYLRLAELNKKDMFYVAGKGLELKHVESFAKKHSNVKLIGMLVREEKEWFDLIGNAKALVLPIMWEEPFGLVMIESMSCGTPVIAYNRGSVPEVIKDGETGFITKKNEIKSLQESINTFKSISKSQYIQMRKQSRIRAEQYFTSAIMAKSYEKLYMSIIEDFKSRNL